MRSAAVVAVGWALPLAVSVGQTHAYVVRPQLPRFGRARSAVSGLRSLRCGATSSLIEATACQVLRLVLRNGREAHVSCSIKSDRIELLQGRIRGASVNGRGWASRLGLTARSIDVGVGSVNLDVGTLFRRRVLQFQHPPPSGNAIVVFNEEDFGNFLAHPLIRRTVLAGRTFVFNREGVTIDTRNRNVEFGGRWGGQELRIALHQSSHREPLIARVVDSRAGEEEDGGSTAAVVDATREDAVIASEMSDFFNNLEVDLDGPRLTFSSLSFEGGGGGGGGVGGERLKLSLGIVVRKFPGIRAVASF